MTFQIMLAWAGGFVMAVAFWAVYFAWCKEHDFHPVSELLAKFRKLPLGAQVFLVMFTGVFFVYGSTKTNAPP